MEVLQYQNYDSAYEIDPQVSMLAITGLLTPMTGNSDVLAYGKAMTRDE